MPNPIISTGYVRARSRSRAADPSQADGAKARGNSARAGIHSSQRPSPSPRGVVHGESTRGMSTSPRATRPTHRPSKAAPRLNAQRSDSHQNAAAFVSSDDGATTNASQSTAPVTADVPMVATGCLTGASCLTRRRGATRGADQHRSHADRHGRLRVAYPFSPALRPSRTDRHERSGVLCKQGVRDAVGCLPTRAHPCHRRARSRRSPGARTVTSGATVAPRPRPAPAQVSPEALASASQADDAVDIGHPRPIRPGAGRPAAAGQR
jgi:hypothetical protein